MTPSPIHVKLTNVRVFPVKKLWLFCPYLRLILPSSRKYGYVIIIRGNYRYIPYSRDSTTKNTLKLFFIFFFVDFKKRSFKVLSVFFYGYGSGFAGILWFSATQDPIHLTPQVLSGCRGMKMIYTGIITETVLFSQNTYNKIYGTKKNKFFQDYTKETYHVSP